MPGERDLPGGEGDLSMLHFTRLSALRFSGAFMALLLWFATAQSGAIASDAHPRFDQQALDVMIAPIALYPDQLLTQVLMAATYPQEVEEAARWSRARPGLTGDAAVRTAEEFDWDPSVRSLTAFPHVLDTMAQYMTWTEDLGQAFIAQPQDVMDTVQRLRHRARDAGTLASTEYTRVIDTGSSLVIESVEPQVVYVPHYDTTVVYGPWWWPARPPMYWPRWHGYHDSLGRPRIVHWGPGTWVRSGFFFGGFDWPRREVRIVNTRSYYYGRHPHAHPVPHAVAPHVWRHDPARRAQWRARAQPVQAQQQLAPQARPQPPANRAVTPREAQVQGEGSDPRIDRRGRRSRDADDPPVVRPRTVDNPPAQQAVPRTTPHPPAASPVTPREAQPQGNAGEPGIDRRGRRSQDADDGNPWAGPRMVPRPAANPAAQPPAGARAPAMTPSAPSLPAVTAPAPVRSALPPGDASREDAPRRRNSRGRDSD